MTIIEIKLNEQFLKVKFLVFVPVVATNKFVKNRILAPNVGPLPQTQ